MILSLPTVLNARALRPMYGPQTDIYCITRRDAAERILTWEYDDTELALSEIVTFRLSSHQKRLRRFLSKNLHIWLVFLPRC